MLRTRRPPRCHVVSALVGALAALGAFGCGCRDAQSTDPPATGGYTTQTVSYPSDDITLSGIMWHPPGAGPYPALVLVDGSGKTRAEDWAPWIAKFTGLGIACLSYDKRGVGASGGTYRGGLNIDIPLLAADVVAGVEYLKSRDDVDVSRIGLLGVSQAGWIIPVAAVTSSDVSFTVIFSGATVTVGEENYYSQLTGDDPFWSLIYGNLSRDEISRRLAEKGPSRFDPLPYLRRMNAPGLWLYGELDESQPTRESVAILDRLIKELGKDFTYVVFEGADHSIMIDGESAEGLFSTMEGWISAQLAIGAR